jgi:hypothetical protein
MAGMNPADIEAMNERIAERWQAANAYPTVPVSPPKWAAKVIDTGDELVAIHKETAAPFAINLHHDLDPEDRAIVIGRRILRAGGSGEEIIRFILAFELPQYARDRLVRQVREATS